jgi:hypothetical protein
LTDIRQRSREDTIARQDLEDLLAGESAQSLLVDAEVAHIAIDTGRGPHVTPELFSAYAGRLWFATARRTLKARKTETGTRIGVFVEHGPHGLMMVAEARALDVIRPDKLLQSPHEIALWPTAAAGFVLRNAGHLLGFVAQGPWAWPRSLSSVRMFVALRPVAAALLFHDEIRSCAGEWRTRVPAGISSRGPRAVDASDLPDDLEPLAEGFAADAVISLDTPGGPVALPCTWDGERSEASVRRDLLVLAGVASDGPAAVEVDRMRGYAMAGKRGVLLRGEARITHGGRFSTVSLDVERATYWEGMETNTVPASTS